MPTSKDLFPKLARRQHFDCSVARFWADPPRKANLGELAIQEVMHDMALNEPEHVGVFLFEDHKIARATFLLPENCRKVTTRAFLQFLEEKLYTAV